jgi:transcriptional regulator with XRE-family HTH domain
MSIREISRRTGLARNTVKKYLRSDETEPSYERRASSSKLDPYAEKLATWLGIEATKSRKQRRTLRQIHTPRTYPHREHLLLTKSVGQYSMENSGQTSAQLNSLTYLVAGKSGERSDRDANLVAQRTRWCIEAIDSAPKELRSYKEFREVKRVVTSLH